MPLSWNEIKTKAATFVKEWEHESNEDAEAKTFWDEFFQIFDIKRRRLASFEYHVKKLDNKDGYIDLFWPGTLIVEHKSKGKSLDKAHGQVLDYFHGIADKQLPQYILVSDFENFRLYDLDNNTQTDFPLSKLIDNIQLFGFIAGYQKRIFKEQDPVNIEAAELMGRLHDKLKAIGYEGHELELYLVRLVFCLFADDSNIFEIDIFNEYIELRTAEDGSDLAMHIDSVFNVLNTPEDKRLTNLDENLAAFPYVNGKLFEERLRPAAFDSDMRKSLLDCCGLNWSRISPAIFGSLFQSVMDEKARRNLGAHYTSEKNIMKLIKPLFLDELWDEFKNPKIQNSKSQLQKLHDKISSLRFLDPACGCGNFLIIAYREIRLLEIEIIKRILKLQGYRDEVIREAKMDADYLIQCNVDQFYGIEYEEFPAQIARTAMWLMDHQMNMMVTETFGDYYVRLPLTKAATIVQGNALRIDWQSLTEPLPFEKGEARFDFILGNPPFVGYAWQNEEQKADMNFVFEGVKGFGVLDYVTSWYIISAKYIQGKETKVAFVSTKSITQGEQVGILWSELLNRYKVKIHFAHRTFKWSNEAKGVAGVSVVIVGFSSHDTSEKRLFEYEDVKGEPHELKVKNINPYLVDAKDIFIQKRSSPICKVPEINRGSDAIDDGNLLLNSSEKEELIKQNPKAEKWIRPFLMGKEFLNNVPRFCLWLKNITPSELKELPLVYERVEKVKIFRGNSKRTQTLKAAKYPTLFGEERHPDSDYLAIPKVSSENREYIPIGFCTKNIICGDKLFNLPDATFFHFGILTSLMHNIWMRYTCGRLESRYSYSNTIVYNNYPWPENPTDKQTKAVEEAAQKVLDTRAAFPESSLADLYDPNTMPPALVKAHQLLDKAVDLCYRPQPFANETKRIEFLFELYDKYTSGMFAGEGKSKKKK